MLVVLPQNVHRPDDGGTATSGERHLEAAPREGGVCVRGERGTARADRRELRACALDAGGIDLEPDHLDVLARTPEPRLQLERRDGAGAETQVDHERIIGPSEHGMPCDPPVDAAQAVGAGRSPRDLPDGALFGRHEAMMPVRARSSGLDIMTA